MRKETRQENKCCFCGKPYRMYGNSTWGCWSPIEEIQYVGEKKRCCDECNLKIVVPTRLERHKIMLAEYGENKDFQRLP